MAISNAPQSGDPPAAGKPAADDVRARKREAIGLEPQRPTARPTVQRPPEARTTFSNWWLVVFLLLLVCSIGLILTGQFMQQGVAASPFAALRGWFAPNSGASALPSYALTAPGYTLWMNDDFTDGSIYLQDHEVTGLMAATVLPDEGVYRMQVWPEHIGWTLFQSQDLASNRIETSAIIDPATPDGAAGLIGRFVDERNFYLFTVNGAGEFAGYLWIDGQRTVLQEPATSPFVFPAGVENRLSLEDDGNQMRWYVNQALMGRIRPELPPKRIGIAVTGAGEKPAAVEFDWVSIYEVDAP
jgi:hypothetical protein